MSTNKDGKKTLFGGMKVKGSAAVKLQQTKKQHVSQSQTNLSYQPKQQTKKQSLNLTHQHTQKEIQTLKQPKKQLKHANTSIQQALKQQYPQLQKKQSQNQKQSTNKKQQSISSQSNGTKPKPKTIVKQEQGFTTGAKLQKKSRSQKDYKQQQNQEAEDKNSFKQDRSAIVGNYTEQRDEPQFRKRKPSGAGVAQKSNPFLNQIKKTTTTLKNKQKAQQQKLASLALQQNLKPSSKNAQTAPNQRSKKQKTSVLQQMTTSHLKIIQTLIRKKQAKQLIITLSTTISQIKQQLSLLINKQNHHVTSQEYEQADKLQSKIEELTAKIEQQEIEIKFTQEQFYQMEYQFLNIQKVHFDQEKRIIRKLKLVELDIEDDISQYKRGEQQKIQNQKQLNQTQKKKINRIISDIKNQSQQLKKYQKTFYQDLNSRRKPLEEILKQQQSKQQTLQEQIKELEQKLKKKKSMLKSTLGVIQSTKQKIQEIDLTFEEERHKLQERKDNLQSLQEEKSQLNKKLKQMEENIKLLQKNKIVSIAQMQKQKQSINSIALKLQNYLSSIDIDDFIESKRTKIDTFICNSKQLQSFEQKHKQKKQRIKQLQFKKSNLLSQITKKQQTIKQLKSRIPKLEKQQKQMSMNKNFKGAAMKKNQIKEANDEIVEIKKNIEELYAEDIQIDHEIEEMNKENQKVVDEENQIRKNLAISQFRLALEKKQELDIELEWLKDLTGKDQAKLKEKYEPLLRQELEGLQEEINYIAEEYELKRQTKQDKKQKSKQNPVKKPKQPQQKIPPASTYTPLDLATQQQQQHVINDKDLSKNYYEQQNKKQQHQNVTTPSQDLKQQEPQNDNSVHYSDKAIQNQDLQRESGEQQQYQRQQQTNENINKDDRQQNIERKQQQQKQEDVEENVKTNVQQGEDLQVGGYVPLQLD